MSIIAWIFLGLIAGYVASKLVNRQGEGFFLDIALGIVGSIVGGFFFTRMGAAGVTGFNLDKHVRGNGRRGCRLGGLPRGVSPATACLIAATGVLLSESAERPAITGRRLAPPQQEGCQRLG